MSCFFRLFFPSLSLFFSFFPSFLHFSFPFFFLVFFSSPFCLYAIFSPISWFFFFFIFLSRFFFTSFVVDLICLYFLLLSFKNYLFVFLSKIASVIFHFCFIFCVNPSLILTSCFFFLCSFVVSTIYLLLFHQFCSFFFNFFLLGLENLFVSCLFFFLQFSFSFDLCPHSISKHSNFTNRNTVCPIVTHMEHHGNSKETADRRKQKTPQQVETRFKTLQLQHRLIGRGLELRPGDCCIEPNCYEWNACQHKMRKGHKINKNTLREDRKTTLINKHGSTWILENCWKPMTDEECVQNQSLWLRSRLLCPEQCNIKHRQMGWWIACRLRSSQVVSIHDFTTSARLVKNAVTFAAGIAFSIVLTAL